LPGPDSDFPALKLSWMPSLMPVARSSALTSLFLS
jgi:hypothetical protein